MRVDGVEDEEGIAVASSLRGEYRISFIFSAHIKHLPDCEGAVRTIHGLFLPPCKRQPRPFPHGTTN